MKGIATVICAWALAVAALAPAAQAEEALVAVASNFAEPANALSEAFTHTTGHSVLISSGSTGRLYAQVVQGAPFDVFMAADAVRPARLKAEGLAIPGSTRTYATGRLALWVHAAGVEPPLRRLTTGHYRRLALANPDLAPYGAAAVQVLNRLDLADEAADRQVFGENIAQTFSFVATGNADLGFVALAQVNRPGRATAGQYDVIPAHWHAPIRQDAVLLLHGADNPAALAWLEFLTSPAAHDILAAYGYEPGA
jgi:molybdate transport system substrate-binding protein